MNNPNRDFPQHLRADSISGVGNPLAFFEWLLAHTETKPTQPFTLISLDVHHLSLLNETQGREAGNAALRWVALVLLEETEADVYRIGGDEFVGVLIEGSTQSHAALCERVRARLEAEASLVHLELPAAHLAMIHFTDLEKISPEEVLGVIYGAFVDVKSSTEEAVKVFDSATTTATTKVGLINDIVRRMVSLGAMLDTSHRLANTDSITGLPNLHAVKQELRSTFQQHRTEQEPFAVLLMDGDDLSKYNKLGYLEGDKMIRRLGAVLKNQLRPSDFLARWRTGDEFLAVLRGTTPEQAVAVADRMRQSVIEASANWAYPITISIGIAGYPLHGKTVADLLHQAELALGKAKNAGKNQVVLSS